MTDVVGLDLSLTATGIAHLTAGDGLVVDHYRVTSDPAPGTYATRHRLRTLRRTILDDVRAGDLVVVEGPALSRATGHAWDRGGLWWSIVDRLPRVAIVGPSTLKKFATGNGAATKADMRLALYKRSGLDVRDDNECDAVWLAIAGATRLGRAPFPLPVAQVAALDKAEWPEEEI